jgi:EAL domain-containing protein (putative c-di-GMP-specific phosphodiesterase class I)
MVPPGQFIPLAEETGLIVPIGKWVLETACAQNVAWQKEGLPPLRMAVNLSARQFADEHLLADIAGALEHSAMAPELLELELTESMVMHDADAAVDILHELQSLGVRLSLDDFGTGYSSLSYLRRLPMDTLKIDRSFVKDIGDHEGSDDGILAQAIISLGHSLRLRVIAEGVETAAQLHFLEKHGCDEAQGYYFGKPLPAHEHAALLETRQRLQPRIVRI